MKLIKSETPFQRFKVAIGLERRPVLRLIHIGKCGGRTLINAMEDSRRIDVEFRAFLRAHTRTLPDYNKKEIYAFAIRNPIKRAVSAYNWRRHLVLNEGRAHKRLPTEFDIMKKYETIDELACALYTGDRLNQKTADDFKGIHHLENGIYEFLSGVSTSIVPEQIMAVFCQETLNEDIETHLGIDMTERPRQHDNRGSGFSTELSATGRRNLVRFLQPDYAAIRELLTLYPLDETRTCALLDE